MLKEMIMAAAAATMFVASLFAVPLVYGDTPKEPQWIIHFMEVEVLEYTRGDVPRLDTRVTFTEITKPGGSSYDNSDYAFQICEALVQQALALSDEMLLIGCVPLSNPDYTSNTGA